jgi:hypothetical protein
MRTTLDIDNDVLQAAKELAAARNTTAGLIVSELLRKALTSGDTGSNRVLMNGIRVVAPTGKVVTSEMVRELREKGV